MFVPATATAAVRRWGNEMLDIAVRDDPGAARWRGGCHVMRRKTHSEGGGGEGGGGVGGGGGGSGSVSVSAGLSSSRRWRLMRVLDACVTLVATLLSILFAHLIGDADAGEAGEAEEAEAADDTAPEAEDADADTRPVLSFGGCAFLYPYQLGVAQYVVEHFHTDPAHVRCAAHSAGFAAAFTVAGGVPLAAHWEALQRARQHWWGGAG